MSECEREIEVEVERERERENRMLLFDPYTRKGSAGIFTTEYGYILTMIYIHDLKKKICIINVYISDNIKFLFCFLPKRVRKFLYTSAYCCE